jgi:hypothetical protein
MSGQAHQSTSVTCPVRNRSFMHHSFYVPKTSVKQEQVTEGVTQVGMQEPVPFTATRHGKLWPHTPDSELQIRP